MDLRKYSSLIIEKPQNLEVLKSLDAEPRKVFVQNLLSNKAS